MAMAIAIYTLPSMEDQDSNYVIGSDTNDDLIYARSVETFFICISCNNAVRTEISCGWGIAEDIPMKSMNTSHICVTRCARCYTSILRRDMNGRVRVIVPSRAPRIGPRALRSRPEYQEVEALCTRIPELICWFYDKAEWVAYINIAAIENHHFNTADVICVRGDDSMIGKVDMNFFVVSRHL
jgi:hypothetical protein